MDLGTQIAHGAVRAYVMGERGARNEPATPDDIAAMADIVKRGHAAGALGFSTSAAPSPTAPSTASRCPAPSPPRTSCSASAPCSASWAPACSSWPPPAPPARTSWRRCKEVDWMRRLAAKIGRPVTFALLQVDPRPSCGARCSMDVVPRPRPTGADSGPRWRAGPPAAVGLRDHVLASSTRPRLPGRCRPRRSPRRWSLRCATRRCRAILGWEPDAETGPSLEHAAEHTYLLGDPPDYEPGPDRARSPAVAAGQRALGARGRARRHARRRRPGPAVPADPQLQRRRRRRRSARCSCTRPRCSAWPTAAPTCGTICDASMPTFMLTHWTRDRSRGERLPLELVVKKQTRDTARSTASAIGAPWSRAWWRPERDRPRAPAPGGAPGHTPTSPPAASGCSSGPRATWPR
jgi:N-acyl-D-amino-acid deacylase